MRNETKSRSDMDGGKEGRHLRSFKIRKDTKFTSGSEGKKEVQKKTEGLMCQRGKDIQKERRNSDHS